MGKPSDKDPRQTGGWSRRGFIAGVGAGAVAVAAGTAAADTATTNMAQVDELVRVDLSINGRRHKVFIEPRYTLLYVIRDLLGMTATKVGCERGECGACTVLFDGVPRYACMTLALEAEGHEITTLEGTMKGEELGIVQQAFAEEDAYQCGFCTPGQIMAVEGLLQANPNPTMDEVREGVSGNLCRCAAYEHIFKAALNAAGKKAAGGGQ